MTGGENALRGGKAPAQGDEAGDGACHLSASRREYENGSRLLTFFNKGSGEL